MVSLCNNIPKDYEQVLEKLTSQGYRIIALAQKELIKIDKIQETDRVDLEVDLEFLGFIETVLNIIKLIIQ